MALQRGHPRPIVGARPSGDRTLFQVLKSATVWLSEWCESYADYYAAALLYDSLSRLSDGELERRGLSRATLAHDLIRMRETSTAKARAKAAQVERSQAAPSASQEDQP